MGLIKKNGIIHLYQMAVLYKLYNMDLQAIADSLQTYYTLRKSNIRFELNPEDGIILRNLDWDGYAIKVPSLDDLEVVLKHLIEHGPYTQFILDYLVCRIDGRYTYVKDLPDLA